MTTSPNPVRSPRHRSPISLTKANSLPHESIRGKMDSPTTILSPRVGIIPPPSECIYTSCYCEENVWHLCSWVRTHRPEEISRCSAVFISNSKKQIPLWRQRAGRGEERLVIWDYHVVFLHQFGDKCLVYDLDSELPFPTFFPKYVTETFRTDQILDATYHRYFRVVPATVYLTKFSSDRRHMRKTDGSWLKPPPEYPCLQMPGSSHNLDDFVSMEPSKSGLGEVYTLMDFVRKFYTNLK
ncbi:protein N-terminal glutamine amidohydrolase-like [Artemia franciscana]|uniref:protein N-terminal glutamine amidohydrolase-like n=1 Tax=Artemia franciscana TaxID=6661 RepID=UPI0032DAEA04